MVRKASLALPIVLVSKKSEGDFPVDLSSLAFKLQRVAHVIYEGNEGEIREIILEILEDYSRNVQKDTRRDHIVTDLLENNNYGHIPAKRREQIKVALKGYKSLDGSLRGLLESIGFVITDDGKHYKWTYFGDHWYSVTIAKTSSDNLAELNMTSLIDNLML